MNVFTKKLLYLTQINNTQICSLKIFDIEEEKCYKQNILLRVITSLSGISQLNVNNTLYLCGINDESKDNVIGSYLFKISCDVKNPSPIFLVNSVFSHLSPSMTIWKGDLIIVVGGKEQIECEGYVISSQDGLNYHQFLKIDINVVYYLMKKIILFIYLVVYLL